MTSHSGVLGDSLGVWVVNPLKSRTMQQTMTSSAWLMPNPQLWRDDEVVVFTEKRNYTTRDYRAFFNDMHFKTGYGVSFMAS